MFWERGIFMNKIFVLMALAFAFVTSMAVTTIIAQIATN